MTTRKQNPDMTTIPVSKKTAAALRKLGSMDDTYDTVLQRLIAGNGKVHGKEDREEDEDVVRSSTH